MRGEMALGYTVLLWSIFSVLGHRVCVCVVWRWYTNQDQEALLCR